MRVLSVLILMLLALGMFCTGMRAPDVAPDLPEGWCNPKYGTPTRTTGECICKPNAVCTGPKCVNEQGFIFYSGVECPSCECVEGKRESRKKESHSMEKDPVLEKRTPVLQEEEQPEDDSTIMDFIVDDLPRVAVAGIVIVGVLAALATMLKSAPAPAPAGASAPVANASAGKPKSHKSD